MVWGLAAVFRVLGIVPRAFGCGYIPARLTVTNDPILSPACTEVLDLLRSRVLPVSAMSHCLVRPQCWGAFLDRRDAWRLFT